jgi:hypothetical protein
MREAARGGCDGMQAGRGLGDGEVVEEHSNGPDVAAAVAMAAAFLVADLTAPTKERP